MWSCGLVVVVVGVVLVYSGVDPPNLAATTTVAATGKWVAGHFNRRKSRSRKRLEAGCGYSSLSPRVWKYRLLIEKGPACKTEVGMF
ncbi:hypothetical protein QBC43DRAFT_126666 [Cladorrhinum sp. PSN259]|nr:hypothetical protein QBC43DRAFT_126666 [Cladorrhinum sp. PSN259]